MKIIDDKGKLFGKINVIDFLVIVFLFCLIPAFYFGYKILSKDSNAVKDAGEFIDIETRCLLIKLTPETLKLISVGDTEINYAGRIIGRVVKIGEASPYRYLLDIGEKEKVIKESSELQQLEVTLHLKANLGAVGSLIYSHPIQYLRVGSSFMFTTKEYRVEAIIPMADIDKLSELKIYKDKLLSLEPQKMPELETRMLDLYITLKDVDEGLLNKISVGDREVDKNGETLAEIISLGKIENSAVEFKLSETSFATGEDSAKKQIFTKMRMKCQVKQIKDDTELYFKGQRMRLKAPFKFKTDKYEITGILANIFEETSSLEEKWITLGVKFYGMNPEIASVIQKEDIEKDSTGKIMAKINSIISNKFSEVLALRGDKYITVSHPFSKDIEVSLNVRCVEKDGIYYFKNYSVKMGNNITFSTDLYSITGLIVGMEIE